MKPQRIRPRLLVVSAPSGAGKTTLCNRLLEARPDLRLSISTTTRAPRDGEREGVDYHFVSRQDFGEQLEAGEFVEWAEVHGKLYGTSKRRVEQLRSLGLDVLFDVDVQGADSLKKVFGDDAVTIMLLPPSFQELERRLRGRGTDDEPTIERRLNNARGELTRWPEFDEVVVNEVLSLALADVEQILDGGSAEPGRRKAALTNLFGGVGV